MTTATEQEIKMNKWILNHGCIRQDNSLTSRDSTSETFDTEAEAQAALAKHSAFYRSIGYKIWFSEIKEVKPEWTAEDILKREG